MTGKTETRQLLVSKKLSQTFPVNLDSFDFTSGMDRGETASYIVEDANEVLPKVHDYVAGKDFFLTILPQFNVLKEVGGHFYNLEVFLEPAVNQGTYRVGAIVFLPYVVTSVDHRHAKQNEWSATGLLMIL